MALALEGIKVVEAAQVVAAPMAARHLADFGADVIHIEPPVTGDSWRTVRPGWRAFMPGSTVLGVAPDTASGAEYINYSWENYNRNKRSLALDISQEGGREIIYKLLSRADVFITNLRLFEREKFGLEYETLHKLYPRLIYGSLTGYGKQGPEKNNPAYDTVSYWARGGPGHLFSRPVIPPFVEGGAFGDNVAALALAFGLMTALFVRERTGVGQEVDLSLFHTGIYQMSFFLSGTYATGLDLEDWTRPRTREDALNPLTVPYQTKDSRWLLLSMPQSERWWPRFCQAIEREDLEHDPRFESLRQG